MVTTSFHCDVTDYLNRDGLNNILAVRLENKPQSSRYPGAGLYRNVHLIVTSKLHVPIWGTYVTTPYVSSEFASVNLKTTIKNSDGEVVRVVTHLLDADGKVVVSKDNSLKINHEKPFEQNFIVDSPKLWSPESPNLYTAHSYLYVNDELDEYKHHSEYEISV